MYCKVREERNVMILKANVFLPHNRPKRKIITETLPFV